MLTSYERAKVREATLTFPVLLLFCFLMRGWAGNQFSSATDRTIEKALHGFAVHLLIETAVSLVMREHQGRRLSLTWLFLVEGIAPAYH